MTNGMIVTLILVFMVAAAFLVCGLIARNSRALRRVLEGFPENRASDRRRRICARRKRDDSIPDTFQEGIHRYFFYASATCRRKFRFYFPYARECPRGREL